MSFQSYNHCAYCLLNLATQKKFESEISCASFKFKKTHLVKRDFKPFALSFKSDFAEKFDDFKIYIKTEI